MSCFGLPIPAVHFATTIRNLGPEAFSFSAALHSYLACSDCDAVSIVGNFCGATLVDKLEGGEERIEERSCIQLEGKPYDRVYRGVTGELQLTCAAPPRSVQRHHML